MKKLVLKEKKEYSYIFYDNKSKKEVEMILEFHEISLKLQIGDIIYFPKTLIKDYEFYSFGPIGEKYSKKFDIDDKEIIKIVTSSDEIYLQRFYG